MTQPRAEPMKPPALRERISSGEILFISWQRWGSGATVQSRTWKPSLRPIRSPFMRFHTTV